VLDFEERRKPKHPEKSLSEQRRELATDSPTPHMASTPGFEPDPLFTPLRYPCSPGKKKIVRNF